MGNWEGEDIQMVAVKAEHGQWGPGGGAALWVRERTLDRVSGLWPLELGLGHIGPRSRKRAGCASCLGPAAVEGGVPETRTDSKTTIIETHWAQVLGLT